MPERALILALGLLITLAPGAHVRGDEVLALSCGGCHARSDVVPRINGAEEPVLLAALLAFKRDEREATVMNRIAKGYTDAELQSLARYFAARPEPQ